MGGYMGGVNPDEVSTEPETSHEQNIRHAVTERAQYATLQQLGEVLTLAQQAVDVGKANSAVLGEIRGWLLGHTTPNGSKQPGLIDKVDSLIGSRRVLYGLIGTVAASAVGNFAINAYHLITGVR